MLKTIFILISLSSLLLLYYGTEKNKKFIVIFTAWQILIGILAYYQVFKENPTLFPLAILGTILMTILGIKIINTKNINPNFLLGIHTLRIPVELVLYQLYLQHKIPKLMTFEGWNFDILIGIGAFTILFYQLITKRKIDQKFFTTWNILGIVFLLIIVSLAIMSSPIPIQQFSFAQPNIAVLEFPYCFLPTCVVPIVLMSHILSIKKSDLS